MRARILCLLLCLPLPAAAEEPATAAATQPGPAPAADPRFDVAPRIGVLIPTSDYRTFVAGGLELGYALPVRRRRIIVAFDFMGTRPTARAHVVDPRLPTGAPYEVTLKETELVFGLMGVFRFFPAERRLVPYAGIGPVLYAVQVTQEAAFAPALANREGATKVGVGLVGGTDFRLGPGRLFAEVRFLYSAVDHRLTGDVNLGNVALSLGYRFLF